MVVVERQGLGRDDVVGASKHVPSLESAALCAQPPVMAAAMNGSAYTGSLLPGTRVNPRFGLDSPFSPTFLNLAATSILPGLSFHLASAFLHGLLSVLSCVAIGIAEPVFLVMPGRLWIIELKALGKLGTNISMKLGIILTRNALEFILYDADIE